MRFMHIFTINKHLGPMILIVWGMVKDLMVFAVLLMIFFISFGVCASSLLYPNENDIIHALTGIVSIGYWKIYGELHIEEIVYQNQTDGKISENLAPVTGDYEEVCSVRGRCPDYHWIVTILLMLYLLITNILLINLLIATFASTYEKIRSESDTIWKFQRYELIKEYQDRPVLPPPLIILNHIFYGLIWIKDYFQACIVGRIRTNIEKYDSQASDNEYLSEAPESQKQKQRKTIGNNKNPYGRKVTSQTRNIVSKYRLFTSYDFGLEVLDQYAEFEALMTEDYFITLKIMNNKQHTKVINRISEDQRNHHQLQLQVNERLNGVETKLIERMDIIEKALLDLRRVMIDDTFYDGMSRVPTSISRRNSFTNNLNIPGTPQIIPVSGPSNVTAGNNTIKIASRNAGNKSKNSSKLNTRNNSIFSSKSKVTTPSINPAAGGITPQHHRGIKFSPSTVEREDAREEFQKRVSIGAMQVHNELESETDSSVTHLRVPGTEIKVSDVDQQSFHGSGSDLKKSQTLLDNSSDDFSEETQQQILPKTQNSNSSNFLDPNNCLSMTRSFQEPSSPGRKIFGSSSVRHHSNHSAATSIQGGSENGVSPQRSYTVRRNRKSTVSVYRSRNDLG